MNNPNDNLLNVHQAANFLSVNPGTIRRWAQSKAINGLKVGVRGDWRFRRDDILHMVRGSDETRILDETPRINSDHFVQFYENEKFLINSLTKYIRTGLNRGEACIVIATKYHRISLDKHLVSNGLNIEKARADGQYICLDAAETLSKFMIDGSPNLNLFTSVCGGVIAQAQNRYSSVRAFGEMVALLWAEGNKNAAIELEKLWNELGKTHSFSLFCAYPMNNFDRESHGESLSQINLTHSKVIPTESYMNLSNTNDKARAITLLQQKAASLEAEIIQRKQLEKQKDVFLGIASHELKTPVTSAKAFAQVLHNRFKKQGDYESAKLLAKMNLQMDKLSDLVHDLFDVTKIEVGKMHFNRMPFDLNNLAEEVAEDMQLTTDKHVILKELKASKLVYGDRDRIRQVIINLVSNAIKYSPNEDNIIITTSTGKESTRLCVQDFGMGISGEDKNKIFERFFRIGKSGNSPHSGIGLGLYISNEIIKRHNGQIWVESAQGEGSTFCVTLPLSQN